VQCDNDSFSYQELQLHLIGFLHDRATAQINLVLLLHFTGITLFSQILFSSVDRVDKQFPFFITDKRP
jgi:hypothetical protein